jgi:hypothetical protein
MADSRPQPRGLDIDFTLGRRIGSEEVASGYVSGRPRWAGNTMLQPRLRFPVGMTPEGVFDGVFARRRTRAGVLRAH